MIEFIACSAKGQNREQNEDRIMVKNEVLSKGCIYGKEKENFMALICDGVGSTKGGAIAAEMVASSFVNYDIKSCSPLALSRHIHKVNRIITDQNRNSGWMMATTIAGIVIVDESYILFNMGDTRIYKYFEGSVTLLSKDHIIKNMDNQTGYKGNAITSYIGGKGYSCYPSFVKDKIESESLFLLCSDGIYKSIERNDLEDILSSTLTIEQKERAIFSKSIKNGSMDDISMILIKYTN